MAEAGGFAISAVQLITLFQNCVVFIDQIESLKYKRSDIKYLATRALFERHKLSQLRERLKENSLHPRKRELAGRILESTRIALQRLSKTLHHHQESSDVEDSHRTKPGNKAIRTFRWLASDKQAIEQMVFRLKELNENLESLLSAPQLASLHFGLVAHSVTSTDVGELEEIHSAWQEERPAISNAAKVKVLRIENLNDVQAGGLPPPRS